MEVAHNRDDGASIERIATGFGIASLRSGCAKPDIDESPDRHEHRKSGGLREARSRIKLLEQKNDAHTSVDR